MSWCHLTPWLQQWGGQAAWGDAAPVLLAVAAATPQLGLPQWMPRSRQRSVITQAIMAAALQLMLLHGMLLLLLVQTAQALPPAVVHLHTHAHILAPALMTSWMDSPLASAAHCEARVVWLGRSAVQGTQQQQLQLQQQLLQRQQQQQQRRRRIPL